jgi:hypothetical protein
MHITFATLQLSLPEANRTATTWKAKCLGSDAALKKHLEESSFSVVRVDSKGLVKRGSLDRLGTRLCYYYSLQLLLGNLVCLRQGMFQNQAPALRPAIHYLHVLFTTPLHYCGALCPPCVAATDSRSRLTLATLAPILFSAF